MTDSTVQRYPLSWPVGWKRTPTYGRNEARFRAGRDKLSLSNALSRLYGELRRLGVREGDFIISSDLRVRLDGLPYSSQAQPADQGVAVYFKIGKKDRVLACDTWNRIADNVAAIAAHIECIRGIDRYGVGTIDQAFAGYAALPAQATAADWARVLKVPDTASREDILAAHRQLAIEHHPDRGGDLEQMSLINAARDEALRQIAHV